MKTQYQTLFDYHWHTISRLLVCAGQLNQGDYQEKPGYGHGSIHDLLFHLLRTDWSWRLALQTGKQVASIRPENYPTLESIQTGIDQEKAEWQALLDSLSEAEVEASLDLTNRRGDVFTLPRWRILQHLILHGMQHQAELAQLLTAKGQSPGDIDFIFYD
jgi:uncharacterized damage-inducible protein DinB